MAERKARQQSEQTEQTDRNQAADDTSSQQDDSGQGAQEATEKVAANMEQELEQGFRGQEVDPTPNENYTLAGQNAGAPVPETDEDAAEKARVAQVDAARNATGVAER
jgi:hypothetical protein